MQTKDKTNGECAFVVAKDPFVPSRNTLRGSMTKQLQATMAAIMVMSTISVRAQLSTTTTSKTSSSNTTRKTATDTGSTASRTKKRTARPSAARKAPVESATTRELRELRELMISQQAQLDSLKQQLADRDKGIADATAQASTANASAAQANQQAQALAATIQANQGRVDTLSSDLGDLKVANAGLAQTMVSNARELNEKIESPLAIHYKGVTITPVAFFAAESVYRTRSINSDINTPFNTTPYSGAAEAHTSEFNGTGRQSRLGAIFTGDAGPFRLNGYVEADFLSAGTTSNENQSNSYTLRQRQIWGQAATQKGFTFTGGQMWSLVTETKTGTDNRTENLPQTVDPQYHVGFSWARQYGVRFQQKFGSGVTVAAALEEAQNIFSASNAPTNFFFGGAGTGGGLFNATANYTNDVAPDMIVKAAYDSQRFGHYEIGGIGRFFRDRYYPTGYPVATTTANAQNDTKFGGGVIGNARFPVTHFMDIGLHAVYGDGTGRYGTASLPDTTVHPNGTLALIHNGQGLFSLETHPVKKLDVYAYAGGEYAQRTVYRSQLGTLVGYAPPTSSNAGCGIETVPTANSGFAPGVPANCLGATRLVGELSGGFTYRLTSSPRYGRLQYQMLYSYLTRKAWAGVGGAPTATNGMVFTGVRYYLP